MRYFSQNSQNSKGSALLEFAVIFPVIFFTGIMAFELMNYIRFTSDAGMISREISNAVGRSCAPNVFDTIPLDGLAAVVSSKILRTVVSTGNIAIKISAIAWKCGAF